MSEQADIAAMERRLAVLGHVVVDYDRYNAMYRDSEIIAKARDAALAVAVEGVHDNDREAAVQRLIHILLVPDEDDE